VLGVNVPARQVLHAALEVMPGYTLAVSKLHLVYVSFEMAPAVSEYVPGTQGVQKLMFFAPISKPKVPAGHGRQNDEFAAPFDGR